MAFADQWEGHDARNSLRTTLDSHAYALSASAGSHPPRDDLWHLWHDNVQGWHGRHGPRWKYDLSIHEDFPLAFHRPMPSARPRSRRRNQSLASTAPAILLPGRVHGQEQAESGMLASGRRSSHYRPLARLVARSSGFRQPGMQPLRAPTAVCHCCWLPWEMREEWEHAAVAATGISDQRLHTLRAGTFTLAKLPLP